MSDISILNMRLPNCQGREDPVSMVGLLNGLEQCRGKKCEIVFGSGCGWYRKDFFVRKGPYLPRMRVRTP